MSVYTSEKPLNPVVVNHECHEKENEWHYFVRVLEYTNGGLVHDFHI